MEHFKKEKIYRFGERFSGTETRNGKPQDYSALLARCLKKGKLFEDPEFPCTAATAWGSGDPPFKVIWKRPFDIAEVPKFMTDGFSRFDIKQGSLGNCWVAASIATLTLHPKLLKNVVPARQSFAKGKYAGIFHFRLWKFNRWIDVPVDDRLPVNEEDGSLAFMTSSSDGEFWSALLEKAYAKLHGGYAALEGGSGVEALTTFTGGLTEQLSLTKASKDFFSILQRTLDKNSLVTCSITDEDKGIKGLSALHEYSITGATTVLVEEGGEVNLIRLRNPWGSGEWSGPWSDKSDKWDKISEETRQDLGLTVNDDGEFWISESCFLKHFNLVDFCHLDPGSMVGEAGDDAEDEKHWEVAKFEGSWVPSSNAGGTTDDMEKFATNPQYLVALREPDDEEVDGECTMIVALLQRGRRFFTVTEDMWLNIGFAVYEVEDPDSSPVPLTAQYLADHRVVFDIDQCEPSQEVTRRLRLLPGTFCVIPYTYEADVAGDFLLRIYTEKKSFCRENDEEVAICEETSKDARTTDESESGEADEDDQRNGGDEEGEEPGDKDQGEDEVEETVKEAFDLVASKDGTVNCYSLQILLKNITEQNGDALECSLDMCRSMVALMDSNYNGTLTVQEFDRLHKLIGKWEEAFRDHDKDSSGQLSTYELRKALRKAGYSVNQHVLKALILRYGHDRRISLSDFIGCAVKLMCMIDVYRGWDPDNENEVVLSLNEWLKYTMYC
uniref:Calpain catalytic domain-containing protein n=1 Tax=Amblyomma maculatum TaxID=34609 RepID=G3MLV0_AMBMU